jgi:hypothetical protein
MSAALQPQPIDTQGFTDYDNYAFEGDSETVFKKRKVLEGVRFKGSIYHAAQYAGCARGSIYRWIDSDPLFAEAIADATEDRDDRMETSVYERAFNDNLLAMFWLKAHRPKFRDKMQIDLQAITDEIKQRMEQLQVRHVPLALPASLAESLQISPPSAELQKGCVVPSPQLIVADGSSSDTGDQR